MRRQGLLACAGVLAAALFGACGGGPAKDPSNTETTNHASDDPAPKWDSNSQPTPTSTKSSGGGSGGGGGGDPTARSGNVYDKDATEIALKRGSRQVKENCGHAKDTDGKLTGPFGKTTIQLTLGHNGHMKDVKVNAPFDGKPTGNCIIQSFDNTIFPPWAGADTTIDWEVEVVKPQ